MWTKTTTEKTERENMKEARTEEMQKVLEEDGTIVPPWSLFLLQVHIGVCLLYRRSDTAVVHFREKFGRVVPKFGLETRYFLQRPSSGTLSH